MKEDSILQNQAYCLCFEKDRHWIESLKSIIELKHVRNFEILGAGNVNFPPVGILHERVVQKDAR
jgi:hypothetical protein